MNFWPSVVLKLIPIFFVVSVIFAINLYPGGNIHNNEQIGYVLSHNFLSDLGRFNSFTGEPNFLSMFLFNQAMFLFVIVGIAFLFIPNLYKENKLTYILAWLGSLSFLFGTLFFAFVGLTPYDLFFEPHVFFAVNAFRLIIPGILLYVIVLIRSKSENLYIIALSFLLAATLGYVIFQLFHNDPRESYDAMVLQASIQKIIVLINIICIFVFSFAFESRVKKFTSNTQT